MNTLIIQPKDSPKQGSSRRVNRRHAEKTMASLATQEEIARRAYEIFLRIGRVPGQCENDSRQAEAALKDQHVAAGLPPDRGDRSPSNTAEARWDAEGGR